MNKREKVFKDNEQFSYLTHESFLCLPCAVLESLISELRSLRETVGSLKIELGKISGELRIQNEANPDVVRLKRQRQQELFERGVG